MDAETIDNRIRRAFNGIRQAFRSKITHVKAIGGVQQIQVGGLGGKTVQDLKHAENSDFTSNPPVGNDCVVVPLDDKTSHGIIVITTNGTYRITGLVEGETAVYNADGAKTVLKKGRIIEIDCEMLNVGTPGGTDTDAPNVSRTAQIAAEGRVNDNGGMAVEGGSGTSFASNVKIAGDLDTIGRLTSNDKSVGSDHKHTDDSDDTTSNSL